jgi:hypothetical protein
VIDCLPSKLEALNSNPSTKKKEKEKLQGGGLLRFGQRDSRYQSWRLGHLEMWSP